MAFSSNSGGGGSMSDINVTPLVDVLLVLLIIFMVTSPIASYPIEVNLPQRSTAPPPLSEPPPPIRLRIDAAGQVFWNDSQYPLSTIAEMMVTAVQQDPSNQPQLEIDTNSDADYGILAKVLAHAKNADMKKIGFVEN
jgi:biopolymer transport protein ExbD